MASYFCVTFYFLSVMYRNSFKSLLSIMMLSDCTDRNVAGVNESSFSVPVLLQTQRSTQTSFSSGCTPSFFVLFFLSFTIHLSPSNPPPSYSLLFVVSSWFLSPLQNQYFQVSRCSEILLHAKKCFPKYYGYLAP